MSAKPGPTIWDNPLTLWMIGQDLALPDFAALLGVPPQTVRAWTRASKPALPELPFAYEIERVTRGIVPMEAWLAHPDAIEQVTTMRRRRQGAGE